MENKSCFTVRNLSFSYGEKQILRNLTLEIQKGKITTLMGANGCGKSTLFQVLTKNLRPDAGQILLGDTPLERLSLSEFSRKVAIVHQSNSAPGDLTVERLVAYGRIPYTRMGRALSKEKDEQMVERAMQITGILGIRKKPIAALSGGQRQRVWIAMAIAQGTGILLLDEPTTYLDVRYQLQILRLVRQLNQKLGITILMVLHDINQALYYSDEIVALSPKGTLVTQGTPAKTITSEMLREVYGITLDTMEHEGKKLVLTV